MEQQQTVPNINILSFQQQDQSPVGKFLTWSLHYGRIIIIVTELLVVLAFISRFYFDRRLNNLRDGIDVKTDILERSKALDSEYRLIQQSLDQTATLVDNRKNYALLLQHVTAILPNDFALTDLSTLNKKLTISGTLNNSVMNNNVIALNSLLNTLSVSKYFTDAALNDVSIKDNRLVIQIEAAIDDAAYKP